jgi:hypothetical protein
MNNIVESMEEAKATGRADAHRAYKQLLYRAARNEPAEGDAVVLGELCRELGISAAEAQADAFKISEFMNAREVLDSIDSDLLETRLAELQRRYREHDAKAQRVMAELSAARKKIEDEDVKFAPQWFALTDARKNLERTRQAAVGLIDPE